MRWAAYWWVPSRSRCASDDCSATAKPIQRFPKSNACGVTVKESPSAYGRQRRLPGALPVSGGNEPGLREIRKRRRIETPEWSAHLPELSSDDALAFGFTHFSLIVFSSIDRSKGSRVLSA